MKTYVRPITLMRCFPTRFRSVNSLFRELLFTVDMLHKEHIHLKVFGNNWESIYFVNSILNNDAILVYDK